ncbi:MAG: cysteine desulfurase family protein [Caldilineaceae bacterium]
MMGEDAQRQLIYMDHSATTPVAPAVVEAMVPWFGEMYGNPSSLHGPGRKAAAALQGARRTIGALIGARAGEVVFTSGGTEGANAALRGIALARRERNSLFNRIVTSAVEHKAVLATAEALRDHHGFALTVLAVDGDGRVDPAAVERVLAAGDVALVSLMYANNEIGTIQPLAEVGAMCRSAEVPLHSDAVQAAGRLPLDVSSLAVDALSTSAHTFYGPKGVGFLYLRTGTPFVPQMSGGSHEGGRRGGTENVPLIIGMAHALALVEEARSNEGPRLRALRDRLIGGVLEEVEGARLTGPRDMRLDHHASFVFEATEAEGILIALDLAGVAASSGSACTSAAQRPSHVLEAIGIAHGDAAGGLRLSLGRSTTTADVDRVLAILPEIVRRVRG